jgi:hypothetical protein
MLDASHIGIMITFVSAAAFAVGCECGSKRVKMDAEEKGVGEFVENADGEKCFRWKK